MTTDRLPELDRILRLEMAAAHIVGAGERHERDLARLPQRQHAVLQRRVQAPVGIECETRLGIVRIGLAECDGGTGVVVEVAAGRRDDIGRIIGAAQEHDEQPAARLRCGEGATRDHERRGGGRSDQQVAAMDMGAADMGAMHGTSPAISGA